MSRIFKYSGAGAGTVGSQEPEPQVFGVLEPEPEPQKCDGSATLILNNIGSCSGDHNLITERDSSQYPGPERCLFCCTGTRLLVVARVAELKPISANIFDVL